MCQKERERRNTNTHVPMHTRSLAGREREKIKTVLTIPSSLSIISPVVYMNPSPKNSPQDQIVNTRSKVMSMMSFVPCITEFVLHGLSGSRFPGRSFHPRQKEGVILERLFGFSSPFLSLSFFFCCFAIFVPVLLPVTFSIVIFFFRSCSVFVYRD